MYIADIIWIPEVVDKLEWKHNVTPREVDDVMFSNPLVRKIQKGHRSNEDVYVAFGQTEAGRYLSVFFVYKVTQEVLIISARDMDRKERRLYGR